MTVTTRLGLALLPTALLIGILGDGLLRATPWGVNVFLWVLAGLAALFVLARRLGVAALGEGKWLAIPALLLAAGLAWRDLGTLRALDICGLLVCLALGAARTRVGQVRLSGFLDYFLDVFHAAIQAAFGGFPLAFRDVEWGTIPRTGWLPRALAVVRGLVLVLPLLLGLHWLQRPGDARAQRLFSWQGGVQVALLFVIMASALARMRLYQSEYGLTELRLYTTAFMGWLAVVFLWLAATVLWDRRERFAFGAAACAFGLVVALHIVNPDDMIVRVNLAHAGKGRAFDADYAASLSADAVPALTAALPTLPLAVQGTVAVHLLPLWSQNAGDWRSWSLGRAQAFRAVQSNRADLLADQKFAPPRVSCR